VDIGGTQTRLRVVRDDDETLGTARTSTSDLAGPAGLVAWVSARIGEVRPTEPLATIAVAAPGPLDPRRGVLVTPPTWSGGGTWS
jgi:glucokinase